MLVIYFRYTSSIAFHCKTKPWRAANTSQNRNELSRLKKKWNSAMFMRLSGLFWSKVPLTSRFFPFRFLALLSETAEGVCGWQRASLNKPATFVYFLKGVINGSLGKLVIRTINKRIRHRGNCRNVFHSHRER